MNKRFIRVAVFCALTATAAPVFVGCSDDYDADIANLQDQINKINGIIGVSSDDMTTAINQVVEQMQAKIDELSATVDGKVNTEELTAQVEALNTLIDQKADPSAIQAESEKLAGLIEAANKAAADANAADREALEQQISELEGKQEEAQLTLNEALAGKVDANTLQTEAARLEELIAEAKEIASGAVTSDQLNSMISSVQGQIEAALAGKASTEDLTELQNKLNEAINGKITPAEVDEKLAEINAELTEAIGKKMDAALFNTLKTQLETAIAGKADPALVDEKVAALEASLETVINGKADAVIVDGLTEKLETAAADLATAQNELKALQELAENFGAAMAELTTVKSDLTELGAAIADLQDKDLDLTHYAQFVTLSDKVTTLESQYGDLSDSVATNTSQLKEISEKIDKFFNEEGEGTAKEIYTRLKTLEDWKSDVEEGLTGILDKVDVSGLEDGTTADLAQMLADIADLKEQLGLAAQDPDEGEEEGDDATANFYNKEEVDKKFNELQTLMESVFGAGVQSLAYVPYTSDGITSFSSLVYAPNVSDEKKDVALVQGLTTKVRFRVSPASAAQKLVDDIEEGKKYALTFEGLPIKGSHGVFNITGASLNANNSGIVEFNVEVDDAQIGNGQTWAVALGLKALDPVKEEGAEEAPAKSDYTDITSDYFVVKRNKTRITRVDVKTAANLDKNLIFDEADDAVNFSAGSWIQGTLAGGGTVGTKDQDLVDLFGNIFTTTYAFTNPDVDNATFNINASTGTVTLDKPGTTNLLGMTCGVKAVTTIAGVMENGKLKNFETNLGTVEVVRGETTITLNASADFGQYKDNKWTAINLGTVAWSISTQEFELSQDLINKIVTMSGLKPVDFFAQASNAPTTSPWEWTSQKPNNGGVGGAKLIIDGTDQTIKLQITGGKFIVAGEKITATPTVLLDNNTEVKLTINLTLPASAGYPTLTLQKAAGLWSGNAVTFKPDFKVTMVKKTVGEGDEAYDVEYPKFQSVSYEFDVTRMYNDYSNVSTKITGNGGDIDITATYDANKTKGVVDKNADEPNKTPVLVFTPKDYNGGSVSVNSVVGYGEMTDAEKYKLNGTVTMKDMSGQWTLGKVVNDGAITDLTKAYVLTEGTTWKDGSDYHMLMWKDGVAVAGEGESYPSTLDDKATNGLIINGLTAPTIEVLDKDYAQYFDFGVDGNPMKFRFTDAARTIVFNNMQVRIKINVKTPWGGVPEGYNDATSIVTLTLNNQ